MKRAMDIVMALTGLLVAAPVITLLALLVFAEHGHSPLFLQARLGRGKRVFRIVKLRTYYRGQVTRVGRFLRKTGLDELPQLGHVLIGQMSIIGPRPLTPMDVARLGWDDAYHRCRWHLRPGMTGLGQLYAGRGKRLSWFCDHYYLQQSSAWFDCKIIAATVAMNLLGKHRVRRWLRAKNARQAGSWQAWLTHFLARRQRPVPAIPRAACYQSLPKSLARSLAVFQLGESGGGTIVDQLQRAKLRGVNGDYRKAMALFVAEEHHHAEILAACVVALNGRLLEHNWTDRLFVICRRLLGVRLKVLVLLAAEVVGICYYRLLANRVPASPLQQALHGIVADEQFHLRFHCEFLRLQANTALKKRLFTCTWYGVTLLAMVVVLVDHRRVLCDLRIPCVLLVRRWLTHIALANEFVTAQKPRYHRLAQCDANYA